MADQLISLFDLLEERVDYIFACDIPQKAKALRAIRNDPSLIDKLKTNSRKGLFTTSSSPILDCVEEAWRERYITLESSRLYFRAATELLEILGLFSSLPVDDRPQWFCLENGHLVVDQSTAQRDGLEFLQFYISKYEKRLKPKKGILPLLLQATFKLEVKLIKKAQLIGVCRRTFIELLHRSPFEHNRTEESVANISEQEDSLTIIHDNNAPRPSAAKGGRDAGPLREAVEMLYLKLHKEGNFYPLKKGKPSLFIEEMKNHMKKGDSDISDFISERIFEIKKVSGQWQIIPQKRVLKSSKSRETIQKSDPWDVHDVSTILSVLRKSYSIPI